MEQKKRPEQSWADVQQECHQLVDGILARMGQKRDFQANGSFPTFTQRELLADTLAQELGSFLLEKSIATDAGLQKHSHVEKAPCPRCGRLALRLKDKDGKPRQERLMIESRVGSVPVDAPLFHCWKCRKNFSPLKRLFASE